MGSGSKERDIEQASDYHGSMAGEQWGLHGGGSHATITEAILAG